MSATQINQSAVIQHASSSGRHREVHGIMKNGERFFLGAAKLSDEGVTKAVADIEACYAKRGGTLTVNSCVYYVCDFTGIQITPPARA